MSIERGVDANITYDRLDEILGKGYFKSIDLCGDEFARAIKNFKLIYRKAKDYGLKLKAHVGEFGTAEDIREAVKTLELSEVHHGIATVNSKEVMKWLSDNKIQLNICPTSKVMLKRVNSYVEHPIKVFYDYGIPVTINTDDLLIFNSTVSEEFMKLFNHGVFSCEELEIIRQYALKSYL